MKFLVAIDSYKGCLTSLEAGEAACHGILSAYPQAEVKVIPVSDGGDGMLNAFVSALDGSIISVETRDAMMRHVTAKYGVVNDTVILEVAQAYRIVYDQTRRQKCCTCYKLWSGADACGCNL